MNQTCPSAQGKDHEPVNLLISMNPLQVHGIYLLSHETSILLAHMQLCEKGKQIAEHLGIPNFRTSNGWLDRWKKRYNVKKMKITGESGDVSGETVDSWKERIPELLQGYSCTDMRILMKQHVFGGLYLTMALERITMQRWHKSKTEGDNCLIQMQLVRRKQLLLFGSQRSQGVSRG